MEHVNGWCFRGIYKGGLWENDLHVSAQLTAFYCTTIMSTKDQTGTGQLTPGLTHQFRFFLFFFVFFM